MTLRSVLLVAACSLASVSPSAAQDAVRVAFANGRVSITANNATIPEILREWARVGGSSFINAEKIRSTERLTLRLENETELRAIEVLLRPFAGYAVAQRAAESTAVSLVGRVVIMPAARPAEYPVASAAAPAAQPPMNDFARARMAAMASRPQPDDDGAVQQVVPPPATAVPPPPSAGAAGAPASPIGHASPFGTTTAPSGSGFGSTTSPRPGVVVGQPAPPRPGGRSGVTPIKPKPAGGGG